MCEISHVVNIICPNYSKLLEEGIQRHLAEKTLTDIVFNCEGRELAAHRLLISIFLPQLASKLAALSRLGSLRLNSYTLPAVIQFIYSGKVQVPFEQLNKLKADADKLEFELLADAIQHLQQTSNDFDSRQHIVEQEVAVEAIAPPDPISESDDQQLVPAPEESTDIANSEPLVYYKRPRPSLNQGKTIFIRCCHCEFETHVESQYLRHLKDEHGLQVDKDELKITYRCRRCDFTSEDRSKSRAHAGAEARRGAFACQKCDRVFHHQILLRRHVQYNHTSDRPYPCDQYEYRGKTPSLLSDHKKIHTNNANFKCPVCCATFKLKSYMERHVICNHTREEDRTIRCHLCPKSFARRCDLSVHYRASHHVLPPKIFQVKGSRFRHSVEFTVPDTCHLCDFVPKRHNRSQWMYHLAARHQVDVSGNRLERNIKCNECSRTFYIDLQLHHHRAMVHKYRRRLGGCRRDDSHKCKKCGYEAKSRYGLTDHQRTHSGVTFTCEICVKEFKSGRNLKRHVVHVHDPNVPTFKCTVCTYATKIKTNLDIHLRRKHKDQPEKTAQEVS